MDTSKRLAKVIYVLGLLGSLFPHRVLRGSHG